jgi:uncharacterized membrane protein (UPF0182 family)
MIGRARQRLLHGRAVVRRGGPERRLLEAIAGAVLVRVVTGAAGAAIILVNLWYVLRQLGPVHLRRRYGNLEIAEQVPRAYLVGGAVLVGVLAGWWLSTLQFGGNVPSPCWRGCSESWGVTDPLFGHDLSFYVFACRSITAGSSTC